MLLALLSDIHANVRALDACVTHARARGADAFAVLGDSVGYGAEPAEVVDRVMALASAGATVVQGNHDAQAVALARSTAPQTLEDHAALWARGQLSEAHCQFLRSLPLTARRDDCLLVHAGAAAPERWHYVTDARSAQDSLDAAVAQAGIRHVFGGHVHHQTLYYRGKNQGLMPFNPVPGVAIPMPKHRQWIATVGSVGQPRDGDVRAMYALFDSQRSQLTFFRVAYDHGAAAAAVRRTGQSEFFAQRLEVGR